MYVELVLQGHGNKKVPRGDRDEVPERWYFTF